jgi:hypothetical protein
MKRVSSFLAVAARSATAATAYGETISAGTACVLPPTGRETNPGLSHSGVGLRYQTAPGRSA